ncbi:MAG TPA: hypothetical protein VGJ91_00975 [Polyangiaceae bacterium]
MKLVASTPQVTVRSAHVVLQEPFTSQESGGSGSSGEPAAAAATSPAVAWAAPALPVALGPSSCSVAVCELLFEPVLPFFAPAP